MLKTINVAINKFPVTPSSLVDASGAVRSSIDIDLAALYHHY
ncbi:hypothetical protein [Rhizobium lentis]|nr:hypothetical protein [Rhizobium lentis]